MDPNECMAKLLEAARDGDHVEESSHARAMENWLEGGGEMPTVTREQLVMLCQSVDMLADRMRKEQAE